MGGACTTQLMETVLSMPCLSMVTEFDCMLIMENGFALRGKSL